MNNNPTATTYDSLNRAYAFFNERLFNGELPFCLITMQRKSKTYGYFAGGRFGSKDGTVVTDEIALNPTHFKDRTTEQSLSTLVHEMAHLWQHHFGKPSRTGYHNKEWAQKMRLVGLIPSDTGEPGGKEIGPHMTHYVEPGGAYQTAFAALDAAGFNALYVELWDDAASKAKRKKKAKSKTRYTCADCGQNAWAKPEARLICGQCAIVMLSDELDEDAEGEED